MPYKVKKQGDKYVVYKKDTGKRVGATAGNKEALRKYMAALHINAKESIMKLRNLLPKDKIKILKEDLRAWFGSGGKGGVDGGGWDRYNSSGDRVGKCGDAKSGDAYSACLSKEKAAKLGKDGRAAFVKRKRAAQKKGGDAKKGGEQSKGQKPIKVKTGANEEMTPRESEKIGMPFKGKHSQKLKEADPKTGSGTKPKGSSRRLYTDENPSDTVSIKFRTKEDIADTLNKGSFTSKSHKRQSQIINLIHQRVRAAYKNAKDSEAKQRLKRGLDYIESRKEASKKKTERLRKLKEFEGDSNPLKLPHIDTWHDGQYKAENGETKEAIKLMTKAADEAEKYAKEKQDAGVAGEAGYYRGTIAWLEEDYTTVEKYINDKYVKSTGNDEVLKRLLKNKDKSYKEAYKTANENFADGKNPERKGLSKRVGVSQKMTITQLQKIAKSATGERRRMAQWNLNMKRGKMKNENLDPKTFKDTGKSAPYGLGYQELEERLNLFLEKNIPTDPGKWSYYKSQAKKKFDVYPSAYANGWAAKMYKKAGGSWKKGK